MTIKPLTVPNSPATIVYDIETVPLSEARLVLLEPDHEAPSNYVKPEAIAKAKEDKARAWREKAALSPITGRVAMIGIGGIGKKETPTFETNIIHLAFKDASDDDLDTQERYMLMGLWAGLEEAAVNGTRLISFNGHGFDIPFLVKRSWSLRVRIPGNLGVFHRYGPGEPFIDLMKQFNVGDPSAYISMNAVAGFLGLPPKDGDCRLLRQQLEDEPEKAIAYLKRDLELTAEIAGVMGYLI